MTRQISTDPVQPAKFAHFVLRVSDLTASVKWYETVLGMKTVFGNEMIVFMTYDDEHHRLALAKTPVAAGPKGAPGLDHVAYTLNSLADLLSTYKRLKSIGIETVWPINHGMTTSLYYADPDGNRVEFQIENFATKAELQDYFRSESFAKNPIGVQFDPAHLLARYERGDDIHALLQQGVS